MVFFVVTDIPQRGAIIAAIGRIEVLNSGPIAVGTRFRETRRMLGREATEEMTVTHIVPAQRLVLGAFNHGTRYRTEYILEPGTSGTRLRHVFTGTPERLFAQLLTPLGHLMLPTLRRMLVADLADLKREAERRAGDAWRDPAPSAPR